MTNIDFTKVIRMPVLQEHIDRANEWEKNQRNIGVLEIATHCVLAEAGKDFFGDAFNHVGINCLMLKLDNHKYRGFSLDEIGKRLVSEFDHGYTVSPCVVTLTPNDET